MDSQYASKHSRFRYRQCYLFCHSQRLCLLLPLHFPQQVRCVIVSVVHLLRCHIEFLYIPPVFRNFTCSINSNNNRGKTETQIIVVCFRSLRSDYETSSHARFSQHREPENPWSKIFFRNYHRYIVFITIYTLEKEYV